MKKTNQKSIKDFAKKSIQKDNLKMIKGGSDGSEENTTQVITDDIIHL